MVSMRMMPYRRFQKNGRSIVDWLKNSSDIFRLSRICSAKGDPDNALFSLTPSDYFGVPLGGAGTPYLSSNTSAMGRMVIKKGDATRSFIIMSDAEAYLLRAEAVQRGSISRQRPKPV